MKVLAIDPGTVRIGIAISDQSGFLARPLMIIRHVSRVKDAENIVKIAEENECSVILIGQALDSEGQQGLQARTSQKLAAEINRLTDKRIMMWDESYSSRRVHDINKKLGRSRKSRSKPIDDQAAAMLLDDFLKSDSFSELNGNSHEA